MTFNTCPDLRRKAIARVEATTAAAELDRVRAEIRESMGFDNQVYEACRAHAEKWRPV